MTKYLMKLAGALLLLAGGFLDTAYAVPSFARQTGFDCTVCHTVFPELTQTGREFKLRGYTMSGGETSIPLPLAAMLQIDATKSSKGTGLPKDGEIVLDQAGLFYGGKITDHAGAFVQVTYDGTALPQNKDVAHHIAMDNMDIRYADSLALAGTDLVYGITLNNNPTMSDLWNSTPAWGFPYASSAVANTPAAATIADGGLGQKVGGAGIYALWNDLLYAEAAAYKSARAKGPMGLFGWNNGDLAGDAAVVKGTTPYLRMALQQTFGDSYLMVGGYALTTTINPMIFSNAGGPLDTYSDRALDAEYQYMNGSSMITATATKIWETQKLGGSVANLAATNLRDTLTTEKTKISYYYDQRYGVSLGTFATAGTSDAAKYDPDNGVMISPNSRGETAELDYLPRSNVKLALQYNRFDKFNGASKNYDGAGRNASDNNHVYLLGWLMF